MSFKNVIYWENLNNQEKKHILLRPSIKQCSSIKKTVQKILKNVKNFGDQALKEYTSLFDKNQIKNFQIPPEDIACSGLNVNKSIKNAILVAKKNITQFHAAQVIKNISIETQPGVLCEQIHVPLNTIGIYIPGGQAPLLSTVLMLAVPSKIAGCKNVILCSPPPISNEILYTSYICGVSKVFQVGGAQAIGALAFGTDTIPKVDKIFGPGNMYVTEAKLQVSSIFNGPSIDMLAGPSELLIIADETSIPEFIAADLLSQLEHGASSQVILLTPCALIAQKVILSINKQLIKLTTLSKISTILHNSIILIVKNLSQCIEISNLYSPEHLIIHIQNPRKILNQIFNAGSIFLGPWSPETAGDYASGTNHVLPTYGKSLTNSALGIADFQKRILIQELSSQGLIRLSKTLEVLSDVEHFEAHKNAVKIRTDFLKGKI